MILVIFLAGYLSENRPLLDRAGHAARAVPPATAAVPRADGRDVGDRARASSSSSATSGRRCCSSRVFLALLYAATGRVSLVVIGLVLFLARQRGPGRPVRPRPDARSTSGSTRSPTRSAPATRSSSRCTRSPGAACSGMGLGNGLPMVGGRLPIPEVHTDFPLAALGEELGLVGVIAILGLFLVIVERGLRIGAAAADDFRSILATGLALVIGVQAFIIAAGNLKVLPLTGRHAAVHQLRRLVAAGQRGRRRAAARPLRQGRRAATAADGADRLAARSVRRGAPPDARDRRHAAARSAGTIVHVALVLSLAFGTLAAAAGLLDRRRGAGPRPLAERPGGHRRGADRAPRQDPRPRRRGPREQRHRRPRRVVPVYASKAISQVVGYASTRYGEAGLELAYDAELTGLAGDPLRDAVAQVPARPLRPQGPDAVPLARPPEGGGQGARRPARGDRHARPADRRGPRARLDADLRRLGDRRPGHGRGRRSRPCARTTASRSCRGRRSGATCRAPSSRSSPRSPGSGSGAVSARDDVRGAARRPRRRASRRWLPDPRRPPPETGDAALDLIEATEVVVQHLVRADRARDRRPRPRRLRRPAGVRRAPPVRPADGGVPGQQRSRQRRRADSPTTSSSPTRRTARPRRS